jgi:hypothetical protein
MPDPTRIRWSGPKYQINADENALLLEFGIGSETFVVGCVSIQLDPTFDFVGTLRVLGRSLGQVAENDSAPFVPIPYRLISLGGVANLTRALVSDDLTQSAIIEVPVSGLTGAFLIACTAGSCDCFRTPLEGPSTL